MLACCCSRAAADETPGHPRQLKALTFLTKVIGCQGPLIDTLDHYDDNHPHAAYLAQYPDVGGVAHARLPAPICGAVLACADRTAEASAAPVRTAALELCCEMVEAEEDLQDVDGEVASRGAGADLKPRMMSVLLGAAEGERAVLDRRLRERCEVALEKLELGSADGAQAAEPMRKRRRYAALSVEERLRRLRRQWERSGEDKPTRTVRVHVGSIGRDMLDLGESMGGKAGEKFRHTGISFKLDHGVDAGGLTRHCFAEFGKALLEVSALLPAARSPAALDVVTTSLLAAAAAARVPLLACRCSRAAARVLPLT